MTKKFPPLALNDTSPTGLLKKSTQRKPTCHPLILACSLMLALSGAVAVVIQIWAFDPFIGLLEQWLNTKSGGFSDSRKVGIHLYLGVLAYTSLFFSVVFYACSWKKNRRYLTPAHLLISVSVVVVILASLSVRGQYEIYELGKSYSYWFTYFCLDGERRIPTIFSSLLLLSAAAMLALISYHKISRKSAFVKSWCFLSLGFVYLATDEMAKIHEDSLDFVLPYLGIDFMHDWVVPFGAITLVVGISYIRFLKHLTPRFRYLFILSGGLYLGGAIGLETVGGLYAQTHSKGNFTYQLIADVEEVCEMMGAAVFLYSLHNYWLQLVKVEGPKAMLTASKSVL